MAKMLHLLLDWEYPHWMMMAGAKQEWAGQRAEPGPGIHPNRKARGYAGIRIRIG